MYEQIEKPKENKSRAVANSIAQKKSDGKQGFGFIDNRDNPIYQAKLNNVIQRVSGSVSKVEITSVEYEFLSAADSFGGKATAGHKFTLRITGANANNSQLRWYEKTNISYFPGGEDPIEGEYMKVDVWNNMYVITGGASNVFQPWNEVKDTEGDFEITITDIPGIAINDGESRERSLRFRLIVEGSDGSERVVEATQTIAVVDGTVTKHSFVITQNNVVVMTPGGFVGSDAPPYK